MMTLSDVNAPQVRFSKLSDLVPYARNSRTHSPQQIQAIVRSMDEFGWTNLVLADSHGIVAGHGRVLAAEIIYARGDRIRFPSGQLVPAGTVPWVDCEGWTDEQRKAYIIADNRLAETAGWDLGLLRDELADLKLSDFDVTLTGFSADDILDMFAEPLAPAKDPDDVPDLPDVPYSTDGDQWILGAHRVRCGDSTSASDWGELMGGELADVVWTDPPYNTDIGGKFESLDRADGGNRRRTGGIKNDKMSDSKFLEFLLSIHACLFRIMKPGAAIYVAHADTEGLNFREAFCVSGLKLSGCLIWEKDHFVLGRADWQWKHEPILYGWKPGSAHRWFGGRKNTSIQDIGIRPPFERLDDGRWAVRSGDATLFLSGDVQVEEVAGSIFRVPKPSRSSSHPTTKPVELIERQLRCSARTNDIVVDAFGGSGSTLIAADRLGMCARLMELDPRFVDVICARYADYTGRMPVHAVTGEAFPLAVVEKLIAKK